MSKIIQKEKERQERIIREHTAFIGDCPEDPKPFQYKNPTRDCHKQSLINLKEYMEEEFDFLDMLIWSGNNMNQKGADKVITHKSKITEDIKELKKMIERYK